MATNQDEFVIKNGTEIEIPFALYFRGLLFKESGVPDSIYIPEKDKITHAFYEEETKAGRMRHIFAYNQEGQPVAIIGSLLKSDFPYFLFNPGYYGWIIDVYTLPAYRGKGLANRLLEENINWLKGKNVAEVKLVSFGTEARRIYEKRGFKEANVLSLNLSSAPSVSDIIKHN